MEITNRINAFSHLGRYLRLFGNEEELQLEIEGNSRFGKLVNVVTESYLHNGWFVEENVKNMLSSLGKSMEESSLKEWVFKYKERIDLMRKPKTIAVIMAGNIPAVGFHDWMCILMSGNKALAKLSSDDNKLLPAIADLLVFIEPDFADLIEFTDANLKHFDAVIATGSGNTSRYFDFYFGKYDNIIRKNRNGVAILSGKETFKDFEYLADDIFMYYGLGCRNVSKVFVPVGYDFTPFLDVISKRTDIINNHKYFNNYEYNKAIYLVNSRSHFDAGNLLLVEDKAYASPVSVLNFEYYSDVDVLVEKLNSEKEMIQCVLTNIEKFSDKNSFGESQQPKLWDYADGVDTMEFLLSID